MKVKIHYIKVLAYPEMGDDYVHWTGVPEKYDTPTQEQFNKFWVEMFEIEVPEKHAFLTAAGQAWNLLQRYENNPLSFEYTGSNPLGQVKVHETKVGHTTPMVGDIFEVNGLLFMVGFNGWIRLPYMRCNECAKVALTSKTQDIKYYDEIIEDSITVESLTHVKCSACGYADTN
jgi:hypothetical protein